MRVFVPTVLAEVSKALQAYSGYKGNCQLLIDEATAFDFRMQIALRSIDENGVTQISDPTEAEKEGIVDNLWYKKRDESTCGFLATDTQFDRNVEANHVWIYSA